MSHGHRGPSGAIIFTPTRPVNSWNPACRDEGCLFYQGEQVGRRRKRVLSDEICDRCLCEAPCACPGGLPFTNGVIDE